MEIMRHYNSNSGNFGIYEFHDYTMIGFKKPSIRKKYIFNGVIIKKKQDTYYNEYNYFGKSVSFSSFYLNYKELNSVDINIDKKRIYYDENNKVLLVVFSNNLIFIKKNTIVEVRKRPLKVENSFSIQINFERVIINGHLYKRVKKNIKFKSITDGKN